MRAITAAAFLAGIGLCAAALPAGAQDIAIPDAIAIDDATLANGLQPLPATEDIAAVVAAENAAARPDVDSETLADMQADLRAVSADLQGLRAELLASGAQGFAAAGGDSAIDRMNAMEAKIAALTDRTEQLSNRIRQVVADGTNRVGDIEFRLCELDPNCDLGALMTADLGGGNPVPVLPRADGAPPTLPPSEVSSTTLPPVEPPPSEVSPPTEEEAREFAEARKAVEAEDWAGAISKLEHLVSAHAGGPMTADSLYLLGMAQQGGGQPDLAAQSWLLAFSAAPDGPRAPASLLALSRAMVSLGTPADACPYLDELARRFPQSPEEGEGKRIAEEAACATPDAAVEGAAD
ncbi:tol-pal system protein [Paracoccus aurantiacus]|uniref:Tol-pal system protein n=1 Tax=Paracoccus aurantiacus TaxID=2599412 RepID=A0A5C6S5U4_9RHOB|nr:tol-pal system protein [Paracoccus aurantiacus]TXB69667.1 tol-pal system protein [Paracoccus aurantiacus]